MRMFRIASIIVLILGLCSCKTLPDKYEMTSSVSKSVLLDGTDMLGTPLRDEDLPNADVMALTPEMVKFLDEYVMIAGSFESRSRRLSQALFDEDKLNIFYDASQTYTAQQAFENRAGNCLAFSYLYTAMARHVGLTTYFQEVDILPEWSPAADAILVQSRHINVLLDIYKVGRYTVDIDRVALNRGYNTERLEDDYVIGLYYGNIAAELLIQGQHQEAFKYSVKALKLAPEEATLWTNLGVLYKRAGFRDHAEKAYFVALDVDPENSSALSNLAFLYEQEGDTDRQDYYESLVKVYHAKNPYVHYAKAEEAIESGKYSSAMLHIKNAIRIKDSESRFFQLKSLIHQYLGEEREASRALRSAENIEAEALR